MAKSKSPHATAAESRGDRSRWTVEVTQGDIDRAHVNDSYRCVIATALARQIPDATRIEVDLQTIRFTRGDERLIYLTPYAAAGYVVAFDAGDEIEPFSFTLRNPTKTRRQRATPAGRDVAQKRNRVVAVRQKIERAEATLAKPQVERSARQTEHAEQVLAQAPEEIAEAERELEETKAAYRIAGTPQKEEKNPGARTLPKVYKTKNRAYGQRVLRVNQAPGRKHYASTR
jgi:hypothetical protein